MGLIGRNFLDGHHPRPLAETAVCIDHLPEATGLCHHQHVGQDRGERLVPDQFARAPCGVSQPERRLLAGERCGPRAGQHFGEDREVGGLVARTQRLLQLVLQIEIVPDRILVAAGDEDEVLDAGFARLVDDELDRRTIHDGEHLLRDRLGGGEEAGTETSHREDGFADGFHGTCGGKWTRGGSIQAALRSGKAYLASYQAAMMSRMSRSMPLLRHLAWLAPLLVSATALAQDDRYPQLVPPVGITGSVSATQPDKWSGEPGASGHPLMIPDAILGAGADFKNCL